MCYIMDGKYEQLQLFNDQNIQDRFKAVDVEIVKTSASCSIAMNALDAGKCFWGLRQHINI